MSGWTSVAVLLLGGIAVGVATAIADAILSWKG